MSRHWSKLDYYRPGKNWEQVVVSKFDEETEAYKPPFTAYLKYVWVRASGEEVYADGEDIWTPLPVPGEKDVADLKRLDEALDK